MSSKGSVSSHHDAAQGHKSGAQVYGIPTFDALFKYILSDDAIRLSFLKAFIPGLQVVSSQTLDGYMNPLQDFQYLRKFMNHRDTAEAVDCVRNMRFEIVAPGSSGFEAPSRQHDKAKALLLDFVKYFDDLKKALPQETYNGSMDFVCKLENGDFVVIEMQVALQKYWERRALGYPATVYSKQIRKGDCWSCIKKVVGINILGGGLRGIAHWRDAAREHTRHYKFQEQIHKQTHERIIDGIELIQISVMNLPEDMSGMDQSTYDWMTFFKRGACMSVEEVQSQIKTNEVLSAFKMATLSNLPDDIQEQYDHECSQYDRLSEYVEEQVALGRAEGKAEGKAETLTAIVRAMKSSMPDMLNTQIASIVGLSEAEVSRISID
jgi:predicted transposase/invertase (TIGR01784 family)